MSHPHDPAIGVTTDEMAPDDEDLIAEARDAGERYIQSFGGDLTAVFEDLRRRTRESGRPVYVGTPKPPHPWQLAELERDERAG